MSSAAVAVSIVGVSAAAAPSAMALANDGGTTTVNGNGASQAYGNSEAHGDWSPQFALIQGSLNKPFIALPAKANVGSLLGVVPISIQDVNDLSSPQNQQCTESSTQAKGDEALSHLRNDIPILSGNGAGNNGDREARVRAVRPAWGRPLPPSRRPFFAVTGEGAGPSGCADHGVRGPPAGASGWAGCRSPG